LFDPDAVGDPNHQSHDFEPGIAPSGLFWTIPIAPWAIDVDARRGRARYRADRVPVSDFHDGNNAVGFGSPPRPPLPSHVSFDVRWAGNGSPEKIRDDTFHFTGEYVSSPTTISFTAFNDHAGVIYRSDPGGQYNPTADEGGAGMPAVGHERNGVFFR
jgi:hypothetical protein